MKFNKGDRVGRLVLLHSFNDEHGNKKWECRCTCQQGTLCIKWDMKLRRAQSIPHSCGCARRESMKGNQRWRESGKAQQSRQRRPGDPSPLEIAERCLDVHNDAGRIVPEGLLENLRRLRGA